MYIIFLDESGQPGGFDKENNKLVKNTSKYFVLAGFMINADDILKIEGRMKDIKLKYGLNPYHEIKWNTKYKEIGIDFEGIMNMKKEIIRIVNNYKNSVVGIVMDKEYCYKNKKFIKITRRGNPFPLGDGRNATFTLDFQYIFVLLFLIPHLYYKQNIHQTKKGSFSNNIGTKNYDIFAIRNM